MSAIRTRALAYCVMLTALMSIPARAGFNEGWPRVVSLADITIETARFAEADAEKAQQLARILEQQMTGWEPIDSLDRLIAALGVAEVQGRGRGPHSPRSWIATSRRAPAAMPARRNIALHHVLRLPDRDSPVLGRCGAGDDAAQWPGPVNPDLGRDSR